MYRKDSEGWLKHFDFLVLDMLCLQVAFVLAYGISGYGFFPYNLLIYRNMAIFIEFADIVVLFACGTLKNVLKRGHYREFLATFQNTIMLGAVAILYLFLLRQGQKYSRLALILNMILYFFLTYIVREIRKYALYKKMKDSDNRSLLIITTSSSVTQDELNTLMKYCMIYNWRSIAGNEIFNSIYDFIPFTDELKNVIIPEADRTYEDDVTAYDQMKHALIIKAFVDYLQSDSGKMKTIESAFMQRVAPVFLMTNDTNPFITSDVPSFTRDRADGLKDIIFVATPTLAIGYGRGETGKFIVSKLSQNEVLEYNKSIAKYGNKLVIKDQNYDVKQLFVGISKRIT